LGTPFEFRRVGFLALIDSQPLWDDWVERAATLSEGGIPMEMLDQAALQGAEPLLNTGRFLGAARAVEASLNPFRFCWAYAKAARKNGAELLSRTPVTTLQVKNQKVVAVETGGSRYEADRFVIMCGAWTAAVVQLTGCDVPVHHTHAQAFITEPVAHSLNHTVELANFYDLIHGKDQAVAVGFSQDQNGALIVTEAVQKTNTLHHRNNEWGIAGIAADLVQLYPGLAGVQVILAWASPTPFTPDDLPVVGWLPDRENIFVAAGFMQTITTLPVASEWMANMILGEHYPADLDAYTPGRFVMN